MRPETDIRLQVMLDDLAWWGALLAQGISHGPARAAQDFITPFMQINLRDELERDLIDLATAAARSSAAFERPSHPNR